MHDHAEAEHQDDRVHIKGDGVRSVQDIENTVIAEIDNQRIDGIITQSSIFFNDKQNARVKTDMQ